MKIKRKAPRPAKNGRPAFLIGSSFSLPSMTDLKSWFDLEYGGPLTIELASSAASPPTRYRLSHTIWCTTVVSPIPEDEAQRWKDQLQWGHTHVAMVLHQPASPAHACDNQLFSSRVARGLTLLTEGTSYDVAGEAFLNPSDWNDRTLTTFRVEDHVAVLQPDSEDPASEWFRTMGLSKFGLDELETARPRGLTSTSTVEILLWCALQSIREGHHPKVGATILSPSTGEEIWIVSHRTIPHLTGPLAIRRLRW